MLSRESRRVWRTCKRIWRRMPGRPRVILGGVDDPMSDGQYYPIGDTIRLRPKMLRARPDLFLRCFAHEIIHSTGHQKRLSRQSLVDAVAPQPTSPITSTAPLTLPVLQHACDKLSAIKTEDCVAELGGAKLLIALGAFPSRHAGTCLNYLSNNNYQFNSVDIEDRAEEAVSYVLNN